MALLYIGVGIGGACGAMARYAVSQALPAFDPTGGWPWGTMTVNLVGGLLIGFLVALLFEAWALGAQWRVLVVTGFLGGFTTFSAFSLELVQLIQHERLGAAGAYAVASLLVIPLCCALGWWLGQAVGSAG